MGRVPSTHAIESVSPGPSPAVAEGTDAGSDESKGHDSELVAIVARVDPAALCVRGLWPAVLSSRVRDSPFRHRRGRSQFVRFLRSHDRDLRTRITR